MPASPNAVESLRCLAGESEPDAAEALNESADVMVELLAALTALVSAWDEFDDCSGPEPFLDDAFEAARAALAKATGK